MPILITKHTKTASSEPTAGDLREGELSLNIADGKMFWLDDNGVVQSFSMAGASLPAGSIIAYNGLFSNIPSGWVLCDGANSTPDLTSSFIMGTITEADIGNVGGSKDSDLQAHTHNNTATFLGNQLPTHGHDVPTNTSSGNVSNSYARGASNPSIIGTTNSASAGIPSGVITIANAETGSGDGIDANLPPFVKLAYIMKT